MTSRTSTKSTAKKMQQSLLNALPAACDVVLINAAYLLSIVLTYDSAAHYLEQESHLVFWLYINLSWWASSKVLNTYDLGRTSRIGKVVKQLLLTITLLVCSVSFFMVLTEYQQSSRKLLILFSALVGTSLVAWRVWFIWLTRLIRKAGYNKRNIVLLGATSMARELHKLIQDHPEYGYEIMGYFDEAPSSAPDFKVEYLGGLQDVETFLSLYQVDELYLTQDEESAQYLNSLVEIVNNTRVKIKFVPALHNLGSQQITVDYYQDLPVLSIKRKPLEYAHNQLVKRSFDIVFSCFIILTVLSWLTPLLAILIKLDSRGPVFFRQRRTGKHNREFWCYKFRTMVRNDGADTVQATQNDARVTRLGSFLRKSNLDELPQFINVLIGDMSVVGPRPHMITHTESFSQRIENYMIRHIVKPGITGLAQTNGYRGETKSIWDIKGRVKLDILYINNWSIWLDLQVLYSTVAQMVKGNPNAY